MKNLLFLVLLILPFGVNAQLVAGIAPPGTSIVQLNHTLTAPTFSRDSVELDLDCNLSADIKLLLVTGNPGFDAPHTIYAVSADSSWELCAVDSNTVFGTPHTKLYEVNDTMICDSNHSWKNIVSETTIASDGSLSSIGPSKASDTFFAFRRVINNTVQTGWFKVSLDFASIATPFFTIQSYTKLCIPENVIDYTRNNLFSISPSISNGIFTIDSQEKNYSIEVFNYMGQIVLKKSFQTVGEQHISMAGMGIGHYFVRFQTGKGHQVIRVQKY